MESLEFLRIIVVCQTESQTVIWTEPHPRISLFARVPIFHFELPFAYK